MGFNSGFVHKYDILSGENYQEFIDLSAGEHQPGITHLGTQTLQSKTILFTAHGQFLQYKDPEAFNEMRMEMLKKTPLRIFDANNGQVLV